ncbi:unnamed protein product [Arabis nemorensis]|uniref:RSE1/DDB1/CPSF1 second beta-propeller domain-containing protein n=1 Tax=Arabis nemorensis TaxID=586526 RepID=A0A565C271_9BRAS|nr:unnamed protein product [Arabis nemorensis]
MQLVKIYDLGDLEVLNRYTNSGPISDFCVINKPGGRRKILMCDGTREMSFLESSKKTPQIISVWSLKSFAFEANHTYLILQTLDLVVIVYALVDNTFVDRSDMMNGFKYGVTTVYYQLCSYRQFAQVCTEGSVRLLNSKTGVLKHSWNPGSPISCASATNKQILLAIGNHLVYLEVGVGQLIEHKRVQLDRDIDCLDISPLGCENLYFSQLAAVGTWKETKFRFVRFQG